MYYSMSNNINCVVMVLDQKNTALSEQSSQGVVLQGESSSSGGGVQAVRDSSSMSSSAKFF